MERIKEAIERARATHGLDYRRPSDVSRQFRPRLTPETGEATLIGRSVVLDPEHLKANRVVAFDGTDPRSASFDMLRTKILREMDQHAWQTLIVTSPTDTCGKTMTSINLAFSIARQSDRLAVLVDLDLRRPNIASTLGFTSEKGLSDLIKNSSQLFDVMIAPTLGQSRLAILPNNSAVQHPSEIVASREMSDVMKQLKSLDRHPLLVIDMPSMLVADDVIAFLPQADCVLLIATVGSSKVAEIEACERLLARSNLLGIVLNKSPSYMTLAS